MASLKTNVYLGELAQMMLRPGEAPSRRVNQVFTRYARMLQQYATFINEHFTQEEQDELHAAMVNMKPADPTDQNYVSSLDAMIDCVKGMAEGEGDDNDSPYPRLVAKLEALTVEQKIIVAEWIESELVIADSWKVAG